VRIRRELCLPPLAPLSGRPSFDPTPFSHWRPVAELLLRGETLDRRSEELDPVLAGRLLRAGIRSFVDVPLLSPRERVGLLALYWSRDRDPLSPAETAALRLLGTALTGALERERSVRRAALRDRLDRDLRDLIMGLLRRRDPRSLLDGALKSAVRLLSAPSGMILFDQPGTDRVRLEAVVDRSFYAPGDTFPRDRGFIGKVFSTRRLQVVRDYRHWPHRLPDPRFARDTTLVAVPLLSGTEMIGCLQLSFRDEPRHLSPNELEALRQLAATAGVILESARLTEREREAERKLLHAEKARALGILAGGFAHNFRNFLTPILGYAEMAENMPPDDPELPFCLREIRIAAGRARDMAKELLDFTRPGDRRAEAPHPIELVGAVQEGLDLFLIGRTAPVRLRTDLPPEGRLWGRISSFALQQILLNLLQNASEAIGERCGRITVRLRAVERIVAEGEEPSPEPERPPEPFARVEVEDDGPGIPPERLAQLFTPFFTTKGNTGTGLGLVTVQRIVEACGGRIEVESEFGRGTRFAFTIPLVPALAEERSERDASAGGKPPPTTSPSPGPRDGP
jgi:signal transduction histidine kinase